MTDEEIKSRIEFKGEEIKRKVAESHLEFYLKPGAFLGVAKPLTLAFFQPSRLILMLKIFELIKFFKIPEFCNNILFLTLDFFLQIMYITCVKHETEY